MSGRIQVVSYHVYGKHLSKNERRTRWKYHPLSPKGINNGVIPGTHTMHDDEDDDDDDTM